MGIVRYNFAPLQALHRDFAKEDQALVRKWAVGVTALYGATCIMVVTALYSWIDGLGLSAGAMVLMTFMMRTMRSLRAVALLSNMMFVTYGVSAHVYPIAILHTILFPINAIELFKLSRRER